MKHSKNTFTGVKPKKRFGQHFLVDKQVARRIVAAISKGTNTLVEVGPGTGALTRLLLQGKETKVWAVELDSESCAWLKTHYPQLCNRLIESDILKLDWDMFGENIHIVGNFPYFIASQILFKILDRHSQVNTVTCMLQKEVAERIAATRGNKVYGILSVLLQAYYDINMLFEVPPDAFYPRPKVMSAVIQLIRNDSKQLSCPEKHFRRVVKMGFQNRRKTLRNALKKLNLPDTPTTAILLKKRAEQLSVEDFVYLTQEFIKIS